MGQHLVVAVVGPRRGRAASIVREMTQAAQFTQSISQQVMFARLAGCFGLLAVVLIATGLYGTLAYRVSGRFGSCLDVLKDDLADPVGDRVCETMRVAREVGGTDLGTVLRTLADLLRADARTRAELETR